ncbi:ArsR family transcriptional regulator [Sulfolobus sp. S-194]|uniref:winged helix-turn-helix domain-containing protein n=1 Tax=Sulfolobus sp. S-194 TaxID=2512240 RepID=UPI001436ED1C|nr:winged helix-turn-helix domain-containing protein [Sulfolobus sp. S-194]QIW25015.1 ArsR family transcriptional regulator [Sulfolobus sp. S-194]
MELELSPPTKRVYYYLLKKKEATLRQIQEDLGFASVSAVRYHVKKLVEYGLVKETFDGKYAINKIILDDDYIVIFNNILPKSIFFSSFFLTSTILIILLMFSHPFAMEVFASLISFVASGIFLLDAIKRYLRFERTIKSGE